METRNQEIGARIKEARKNKGLTLKELGEAIGRTESLVARYEKGKVEIPLNMVEKIAAALNADAHFLLYGDTLKKAIADQVIGDTSEKRANTRRNILLMNYGYLNENGQEKAIERVGELAEIPRYLKEKADNEEKSR